MGYTMKIVLGRTLECS